MTTAAHAAAPHSVQALEHPVAAKTPGKLGHSKEFKYHEEAIKHATAAASHGERMRGLVVPGRRR